MSASLAPGATMRCPPGNIEVTADGERLRVVWHPSQGVTKRALFRVDNDRAILQHVRELHLRQRGQTTHSLDPDADMADVPEPLLATVRDAGFAIQEEA